MGSYDPLLRIHIDPGFPLSETVSISTITVSRNVIKKAAWRLSYESSFKDLLCRVPPQKLRRDNLSKTDSSVLRIDMRRATLHFNQLQFRGWNILTNTSLRQRTKVKSHAPACTAAHLNREAKFSLTLQKSRRERAAVRRLQLFSALSVETFTTHARYSPCCIFTLFCRDNSRLLIAPLIFETFCFYFRHYTLRYRDILSAK